MTASLRDYKVLTFDCYGTLIDWESGIWKALQPLLRTQEGPHINRTLALNAFAQTEAIQESETPNMAYPLLLTHVHKRIAHKLALETTPELDQAFGESVPLWPVFPDSVDALRTLKRHYKLVILSNVHTAGFAASNRKLGVEFDGVYTAEIIGTYKPDIRNFEYMLKRLQDDHQIQPHQVLHTAQSLHHDHVPARNIGLANAWIDRQRLSENGDWGATAKVDNLPETDFIFFSLQEMADAVTGPT
jgi:2-haloalkanoic acid dehalogenase type II